MKSSDELIAELRAELARVNALVNDDLLPRLHAKSAENERLTAKCASQAAELRQLDEEKSDLLKMLRPHMNPLPDGAGLGSCSGPIFIREE